MTIVGPDGRPAERERVEYKVSDFGFETNEKPDEVLGVALARAREAMSSRDPLGAATISNPFVMEPCAQAVFMYLAIAVAELRQERDALVERVEALEKSVDKDTGPSIDHLRFS
jgi:hypothetical protein